MTFPLDQLKILSDYSRIETANEILVQHKESIIINNGRTNIIPREKIDLNEFRRIPKEGHITSIDYSKAKTTVQPVTLRYSSTSQFAIHIVAFHYDMMA